jgi:hypothetical protein
LGFRFWVSDEIGAAVYNKALTPKTQNPKPQSGATLRLKVLYCPSMDGKQFFVVLCGPSWITAVVLPGQRLMKVEATASIR